MKKLLKAMAFLLPVVMSASASAACQSKGASLMQHGDSFSSPNGKYTLVQQHDGNLVLYRDGSTPRWATYKNGQYTAIQTDGNLVQYDAANQPVWASNTGGHDSSPNYSIRMCDTGTLEIGAFPPLLVTWSTLIVGVDTANPDPKPPQPPGPCNGRPYLPYPVCIPTGVGRGMNGTVTACSQSEAATIASRNGWRFGACTF